MPSVVITQACLHFRNKALFANLEMTIPAKRWTCILGASGVGKSSLLRMLAGLPEQDSTVYSAQIEASDGIPLHGRIAYMAQKDLLMPWLSILDNVLIGYTLRAEKSTDLIVKAKALLHKVGLADYAAQKPAALSGGQRQRVALVRILLENKPIVLMDEPFSALDAVTRNQLQNLAHHLLKDRTVVLVTHEPLEALRLGHYIHVLAESPAKIVTTITPDSAPLRDIIAPEMNHWQNEIWQALLINRGDSR